MKRRVGWGKGQYRDGRDERGVVGIKNGGGAAQTLGIVVSKGKDEPLGEDASRTVQGEDFKESLRHWEQYKRRRESIRKNERESGLACTG